jgi:hypothetical protein
MTAGLGTKLILNKSHLVPFRKIKEAIDDPGSSEMGVGGVLNGPQTKNH